MKKSRSSLELIPAEIRSAGDFLVDVSFALPGKTLDGFIRDAKIETIGPKNAIVLTVTPASDHCVAMSVHRVRAPQIHHCILEFRKDRLSPFQRIPLRTVRNFIRLIDDRASEMTLDYCQKVITTSRIAFERDNPAWKSFLGPRSEISGIRLVGAEVFVDPDPDKWLGGMLLQWREDRVILTKSIRFAAGGGVKSFADAVRFASGSITGRLAMFERATDAIEHEG